MTVWAAIVFLMIAGRSALQPPATAPMADIVRVHVRHCAFVDPGRAVTLGMIALVEGGRAADLADLIIVENTRHVLADGRAVVRTVEDVRAVLHDADGVDLSHVLLSGSTCTIRPLGTARTGAEDESPPRSAPVIAASIPMTILKGHVAGAIARALNVDAHDLRLTFDPRDAALLGTRATGTVEANVTGMSDAVPVRITVYQGQHIDMSESVRVEVRVRREACIAASEIARGEAVMPADFSTDWRWLSPSDRAVAPAEMVGLTAQSRISTGDVILERMVERPVIVERGDLVTVHCVSGTIVVRMPARALEDGCDGDVIDLERLDGQGQCTARISGQGRAVMTARVLTPSGVPETEGIP